MSAPLAGLENLFGWLLTASWQASVLALLVLGLQAALGARLNPRWRYALWLLVLVRLLLPFQVESALSLFQFAPAPPAALAAPMTQALFSAAPLTPAPVPEIFVAPPPTPFSLFSIIALGWLAGVGVLGVLTFEINRRFARQVAASPEVTDPAILALFAAAKAELHTRRAIRLVESAQVGSPAIMGLFRPTLLLPARVRETFDLAELRLIFLHELAHLKRGDVIAQGLIALLQIVHWFNPVLWYAFRRMRADREPAADALVLSRAGEEEKERYGLMLLKLLEHFQQRHALPTLVGILEDKDKFKRRFQLIARYTRGAYGWSMLGVLILGTLAAVGLTAADKTPAVPPPLTSANYQIFIDTLNEVPIDHLQADCVPLGDFLRQLAALSKKDDPKHRPGITFVARIPDNEPWVKVSFHTYAPTKVLMILDQLKAQYPINYRVRDSYIQVWQYTRFQIAFHWKATAVKIDVDFDHVNAAVALKAVQEASTAKGFAFPIINLEGLEKLDALQPDPVTLHARQIDVEAALRAICYLGNVTGRPQEKSLGFEVDPASREVVEEQTRLQVGFEVVDSDVGDQGTLARFMANIARPGQSIRLSPSVTVHAFHWTYQGETHESQAWSAARVGAPETVGYTISCKSSVLDKSRIQTDAVIEFKDQNNKFLGKIFGRWTQPNGTVAKLLAGAQPLTVTLPDANHSRKTVVVLLQPTLVDDDGNSLIPPGNQVEDVSLTQSSASVPAPNPAPYPVQTQPNIDATADPGILQKVNGQLPAPASMHPAGNPDNTLAIWGAVSPSVPISPLLMRHYVSNNGLYDILFLKML